jgi:tetratricopeptide (TPR) repeat protein
VKRQPEQQANAESSYRKAIEVMEDLLRGQPDRREYKEELAKFYNNLGNFHVLRHEFEPALVANQHALELFEGLAAPVRGISNELANGYNSRGRILELTSLADGGTKSGRQREAVEAYQRSIRIFANLERDYKDFAQDSDANARYGNALANLGRLRMESGDLKEATGLLTLAVTHYSGALSSGAFPSEIELLAPPDVPFQLDWKDSSAKDVADAYFDASLQLAPCINPKVTTGGVTAALTAALEPRADYDLLLVAPPLADLTSDQILISRGHFETSRYRNPTQMLKALDSTRRQSERDAAARCVADRRRVEAAVAGAVAAAAAEDGQRSGLRTNAGVAATRSVAGRERAAHDGDLALVERRLPAGRRDPRVR